MAENDEDNDGDDGLPTVTQDNSAWAIHVQRPDGLEVQPRNIFKLHTHILLIIFCGSLVPTLYHCANVAVA